MPFLLTTTERYELPIGTSSLGGEGSDAIKIPGLAEYRQGAIIAVSRDGTATIQRASANAEVRMNGIPLGPMPRALADGARIEYAGIRLTYAGAARGHEVAADAAAEPRSADRAADTSPGLGSAGLARLVATATGMATLISARGIAVGRDADCDLVLAGRGVSRRHAVVTVHDGAFTVVDESANGTFVNGERVRGSRALRSGDVLGFGTEEFRFEAVDSPAASEAHADAGRGDASAPPLATLRMTRGLDAGKSWRVERPVCAIGRGKENDIRLRDESVSSAHASLLFKRGAWYVTDLRSANGTYVDGYRVASEREVPAGCTLTLGKVELRFRPIDATEDPVSDTKSVSGVARRMKKPR